MGWDEYWNEYGNEHEQTCVYNVKYILFENVLPMIGKGQKWANLVRKKAEFLCKEFQTVSGSMTNFQDFLVDLSKHSSHI